MADTLGILFLHHDENDIVHNNLASIRRQNPDATIVTMSAGEPLPGGYALAATPALRPLHAFNPKQCADLLVCSWFAQRREKCDKWWIVEWDAYCSMPVREYYRPVWHQPFVAALAPHPDRDPDWWWFRHLRHMPPEHRPHAMGAVPFLYLMDDAVLAKVSATLLDRPFWAGNCELRFGTLANGFGFPPVSFKPPTNHIRSRPLEKLPGYRGIYHPVKFLVTADPPGE